MYDKTKMIFKEKITVNELCNILSTLPARAEISICGDSNCYIHIEQDSLVVNIDNEPLEDCYPDNLSITFENKNGGKKMTKETLLNNINSLCPEKENIADKWWDWAKCCEETEANGREDSPGEYRTAEMFLAEYVGLFSTIKKVYGEEIVKKVILLADLPACPNVWEVLDCAKALADGKTPKQIEEMQTEGCLDDIRDYRQCGANVTTIFKLIIEAQEDYIFPHRSWEMTFKVGKEVYNPEAAIRAAIKDFVTSDTDEAKLALSRTDGGFNWGDAFHFVPDNYFMKQGMELLDKKMLVSADYDDNLLLDSD